MPSYRREIPGGGFRTLTLVAAGSGLPPLGELVRRETADELPRVSTYGDVLNTDRLDERFLASVPPRRARLYRRMPVNLAQIVEAYARRNEYDAIISWGDHLGIPLAGLFKMTRTRPVHVGLFSWLSKPKKALLLQRVHSHLDRIILWSTLQRDVAVERLGIPPSKIALLRYFVDDKFWRPMRDRAPEMICSAGREMRDYQTLIRALEGSTIPCHIAARPYPGKVDAWMRHLQNDRQLPDHVTFGAKSPVELRDLYARSHFVVIPILPTDTDNGVTCILESMAMGKAVICSRVDGQRDVIQEGKTGLYVPPGDPRALREAIEHLWTHPELAQQMGAEGRTRIERFHTLDAWVESVRRIVEGAILERGGHLMNDAIVRRPELEPQPEHAQ